MSKLIEANENEFVPLNDAGKYIPGRPHRATLWRWYLKGVRRHGEMVKLNTVAAGGRRFTTRADIERFLSACNNNDEAPQPVVSETFRRRAEAAAQMLATMGVR